MISELLTLLWISRKNTKENCRRSCALWHNDTIFILEFGYISCKLENNYTSECIPPTIRSLYKDWAYLQDYKAYLIYYNIITAVRGIMEQSVPTSCFASLKKLIKKVFTHALWYFWLIYFIQMRHQVLGSASIQFAKLPNLYMWGSVTNTNHWHD